MILICLHNLLHILLVKFLPIMGQSRNIVCSWHAPFLDRVALMRAAIAAACQTLTEVAHFQKVVCGFL